MRTNWVRSVEAVIARSTRAHPADRVLREEFKRLPSLDASARTAISGAVFAYYRWLGWLERDLAIVKRLERALDLDRRFQSAPESFADEELMTRAVPAWTAAQFSVRPQWVRSLQEHPRLWLRARRGQGTALAAALGEPGAVGRGAADAVWYTGQRDLFRTELFQEGWFELQDITSQAVGWACDPRPGERWWDVCAGEGGKTLHLSDLMENRGLIRATDRAAWRLDVLRKRAARAKAFNFQSEVWDAETALKGPVRCDGVLVDAPCSGVGTWQRNPHARWTTEPQDVTELAEVQKRLLDRAARGVGRSGRLVYAVCTLTWAETAEVADDFERRHPGYAPWAIPHPFRPGERTARVTLWPQDTGGNGMFLAVWQRET